MTIKTAKLAKTIDGSETAGILITFEGDPKVWSVPLDPDNVDYQEYLAWVDAGNTADAAD